MIRQLREENDKLSKMLINVETTADNIGKTLPMSDE